MNVTINKLVEINHELRQIHFSNHRPVAVQKLVAQPFPLYILYLDPTGFDPATWRSKGYYAYFLRNKR